MDLACTTTGDREAKWAILGGTVRGLTQQVFLKRRTDGILLLKAIILNRKTFSYDM